MKIAAIWDIHGRDIWKDIITCGDFDHTVFVGDYFDAKWGIPISVEDQVQNFKDILSYKVHNKERVTLLLWNHDVRYLSWMDDRFYGYEPDIHVAVQWLLDDSVANWNLEVATEIDDILFTHAWVSLPWCHENNIDMDALSTSINSEFLKRPNILSFVHTGHHKFDRHSPRQSPIWIRPNWLLTDRVKWPQVVWHTIKNYITIKDDIAFIDTLGTSWEYLLINDWEFQIQWRNFLSEDKKNRILSFFDKNRDNFYMRYNDNFEYIWCTSWDRPEKPMLFLREWEVFGSIWETELLMPFGWTIMEIYNKKDSQKVWYHFKLVGDS